MHSGVDDETWFLLLERDDYMCLNCNSSDDLAPAHYISRGIKKQDNSLGNLMLLCFGCHRDLHDGRLLVKKIQGHFYFKRIRPSPRGT